MTKYFIAEREYYGNDKMTARSKARFDADDIARKEGFEPVVFDIPDRTNFSMPRKIIWQFKIIGTWKRATAKLGSGDVLFIQCPFRDHSVFLGSVFKKLKKRGVRIVLLLHDLEKLRHLKNRNTSFFNRVKCVFEDKIIRHADKMIVHNEKMKEVLASSGIPEEKMICLGIFDYLTGGEDVQEKDSVKDLPVVIAGNLMREKSGYAYDLPSDVPFALYGPFYNGEGKDNIDYRGSYPPEELMSALDGSFGLVWDGPSADTCEGVWGEYLKINNPHKTSLYLASGLPVIIWKEAALASFIESNGAGICVGSLKDIGGIKAKITDEEYQRMKENTKTVGTRLRSGQYLSEALKKAVS